jgi:hypothetical protein
VGIGILKTNASIGIPASVIRHPSPVPDEKVPDCVILFRYRTVYGIVSYF